ncbi:hypothetical protein NQ317_004902 [Molorchus minor]|uniref:Uncharacterized protein n=1 Tax=Molorchus minor TaxID=1323400 RepID=A0ABQ9JNT6_9CUCU|nr:hypothetical protein NQ317_004902 [Molorchus minor]
MAGGRAAKNNQEEDTDNMEKLINKVCTSFTKQLEVKMDDRFERFDKKLGEMSNTIKSLNITLSNNTKCINKLEKQYDLLDQIVKRNTLRFLGLEERDDEDIVDTVIKFINNRLRIPCNIRDIDCAFRIGKGKNETDKPRPTLVSFIQNIKRNEVINARKVLKNSDYTIFEDLTTRSYELLQEAKKKYGKNRAWSSGGRVYVWNDAQKRKMLLNTISDL